ncbi:gag/pol protein [Cucumis melo var. makuwa]|uniref:Gag/pol protein n=1 Tax=Cucumis melo var. makuwa TaxID=1194695 RepID=A0A5D3CI24_CUCMM|nr:gag/pol protein [Cucumis melo var. makuwa]TYK11563.1 gag/pol protein [Cucumis melo var. makuwa]
MSEETSIREHVLDMMMHFSIAEVNGGAIDEANRENSSWKRFSESQITLKVGTGEMVLVEAVGDLKLSESHIVIPDDGIEDPLTYKQVINDVDCDQWIKAMNLEIESMFFNSVWTLVDQPNNVKPMVVNGSTRENETKLVKYRLSRLDLWQRVIPKEKEWTMKQHSLLLPYLNPLEYSYPLPPFMMMKFGRWMSRQSF